MKILTAATVFRRRFYKDVPAALWNDWHWQIRARLSAPADFERLFPLTGDEKNAMNAKDAFPVAVTPYYASVVARCPALRKTVLPSMREHETGVGETLDPLGEEPALVAPHLVHRYPDRVLFLTTDFCSTYCRYCTRSRLVGRNKASACPSKDRYAAAFDYIRNHKEVRDVLVSGGDPMTLPDETLDYILGELRAIKHVEMIRVGTKTPSVLPMRYTKDVLKIIKKHHPVYFSVHATHAAELTEETQRAYNKLADAGVPVGSQTVLLRGVNESVREITALSHALLKVRVRPYYLFQCDPVKGSSHFRVPVDEGLAIIRQMRGNTSGYAVPTYAADIPQGGGKVVLAPQQIIGREGDFIILNNFQNAPYPFPDPV
jgi:lysine 2,3-aminomutase